MQIIISFSFPGESSFELVNFVCVAYRDIYCCYWIPNAVFNKGGLRIVLQHNRIFDILFKRQSLTYRLKSWLWGSWRLRDYHTQSCALAGPHILALLLLPRKNLWSLEWPAAVLSFRIFWNCFSLCWSVSVFYVLVICTKLLMTRSPVTFAAIFEIRAP